jgi:hypothetical protein
MLQQEVAVEVEHQVDQIEKYNLIVEVRFQAVQHLDLYIQVKV